MLHKLMDKEALAFLEIDALLSKFSPSSYYGKWLLKQPKVYFRGDEPTLISHYKRLEEFESLWQGIDIERIKHCLSELKNITHSVEKVELQQLPSVVDFFEIKKFMYFLKRLLNLLEGAQKIKELYRLYFEPVIWSILDPRETNQFFFSIDSDYAVELRKELDKYRALEKAELRKICAKLERQYDLSLKNRTEFLLERSDIRNHALKKSDHCTVISENAFSVQYKVIRAEEDADYSKEIERIKTEMEQEEIRYRKELMEQLSTYTDHMRKQMAVIGELDRDIALLEYKLENDGSFPEITNEGHGLKIKSGVLLDVKDFCEKKGFLYDPVSIQLDRGITVIVGANMGGKTTSLKTIGQLYVACAMGLPITAKRFRSGLFDSVHCVYRTSEEEGLSGFAMEVKRILPVFQTGCHLNLIDEFGSATNPKEGEALASSIVKTLSEKESVSVFVTHFSNPLNYGGQCYQTGFLKKHEEEDLNAQNIYGYIDHRLEKIKEDHIPQAAIVISKALGLPEDVIEQARKLSEHSSRQIV
ncbi:MAG: MutS-related protein [Thermotogota bacterium]